MKLTITPPEAPKLSVCVCVCVCVSGFERGWVYPSEVKKQREKEVLLSLKMSDHWGKDPGRH